jgi:hypothetical protein
LKLFVNIFFNITRYSSPALVRWLQSKGTCINGHLYQWTPLFFRLNFIWTEIVKVTEYHFKQYFTLLILANCLLKSYQSHQNIKIMKSKIICISMEINGYHSWSKFWVVIFFLQYVIFDLWVNNYFQLKSLRWMNRVFFVYCHMIYLR